MAQHSVHAIGGTQERRRGLKTIKFKMDTSGAVSLPRVLHPDEQAPERSVAAPELRLQEYTRAIARRVVEEDQAVLDALEAYDRGEREQE